tara:strand:- start:477 stop:1682 length:1206 start_codon:yes stop_codon:yes gene_type:complete
MKKRLLIYTRSYYENKVLYLSGVFDYLEKNFDISILVNNKYHDSAPIKFFNNPNCYNLKISFFQQILLNIKIFFSKTIQLSHNIRNSNSSYSILIETLFKTFNIFIPKIFVSNKVFFYLLNSKVLKSIFLICSFNPFFLILKIFNFIPNSNKKNNLIIFDYILFGSPFTKDAQFVLRNFSHDETKSIALIRNIDTIPCKGFFSIPYDLILYPYRCMSDLFINYKFINKPRKKLHLNSYSKKLISYSKSKSDQIISFAPSCKFLNPFDPKIAYLAFSIANEIFSSKCRLQLRLMASDNLDRFSSILNCFDFEIYYVPENLNSKEVINSDLTNLSKSLVVISSTSTVVLDASIMGIKSALYNPLLANKSLYEREHIRLLNEMFNIPIITNKENLKLFISSLPL